MAQTESTGTTIGFHDCRPPSSFNPPRVQHVRASSCFLSTVARTDPSSPCCRSRADDHSRCAWLGRNPQALPSAYTRQISKSVSFCHNPLLLRPRRHVDNHAACSSASRYALLLLRPVRRPEDDANVIGYDLVHAHKLFDGKPHWNVLLIRNNKNDALPSITTLSMIHLILRKII
jgi:hypothetical protein